MHPQTRSLRALVAPLCALALWMPGCATAPQGRPVASAAMPPAEARPPRSTDWAQVLRPAQQPAAAAGSWSFEVSETLRESRGEYRTTFIERGKEKPGKPVAMRIGVQVAAVLDEDAGAARRAGQGDDLHVRIVGELQDFDGVCRVAADGAYKATATVELALRCYDEDGTALITRTFSETVESNEGMWAATAVLFLPTVFVPWPGGNLHQKAFLMHATKQAARGAWKKAQDWLAIEDNLTALLTADVQGLDAPAMVRRAAGFLERGSVERGMLYLRRARQAEPRNAAVALAAAQAEARGGNIDAAARAFGEVTAMAPGTAEAALAAQWAERLANPLPLGVATDADPDGMAAYLAQRLAQRLAERPTVKVTPLVAAEDAVQPARKAGCDALLTVGLSERQGRYDIIVRVTGVESGTEHLRLEETCAASRHTRTAEKALDAAASRLAAELGRELL